MRAEHEEQKTLTRVPTKKNAKVLLPVNLVQFLKFNQSTVLLRHTFGRAKVFVKYAAQHLSIFGTLLSILDSDFC